MYRLFQEKENMVNIIDTQDNLIHINYVCDNEKVFYANFTGRKKFNSVKIKIMICYPFTSLLVFLEFYIKRFN